MGEPREEREAPARRPAAVVIAYKRVQGHLRVTRIATTLAETGRDVEIVGLRTSAKEEFEKFIVTPHVRGVGFSAFRVRIFVLRQALRPLDALQRRVDALRWRRTGNVGARRFSGGSMADSLRAPWRPRTRAHAEGVELSWVGSSSAEYHVAVHDRHTKQAYRARRRATHAVFQLPEGEYHYVVRLPGRKETPAPLRRFRVTSTGDVEDLKVSVPAGSQRLRRYRQLSAWILSRKQRLRLRLTRPSAGPRRFGRMLEIAVFSRRVWKYCRGAGEDTLWVAHDLYALPVTFLLARRSGGALVYDAVELSFGRRTKAPGRLSRGVILAAESLCRRADCVLVGSPYLARELTRRHPRIAPVLFLNAQDSVGDDVRSEYLRLAAGQSADSTIVLFVGEIARGRGLEEMVRAAPHFADGVHIVMMGPGGVGAYSEALRALAADLGVADRITILGPVPQERLVWAASSADIGISPVGRDFGNGRYNLNNKLFSYIAAGLPVVSSDVEGVGAFVLAEQIGDVFDERDPKSIAECINRLVCDPGRLAEIRARIAVVAEKYSWGSQGRVLLEAFAQVETRRAKVPGPAERPGVQDASDRHVIAG